MPTRDRPADRGRRQATEAMRALGREHRLARVGAGLSLRAVGAASRTSHQQLARFERGQLDRVSIASLGAWCAVVGLDLGLRAYPAGDALRDRAQWALLDRFRSEIHASLPWATEVPIGGPGDRRAWDAVIRGDGWLARIEAETAIADGQALERRLQLKHRDGGPGHVILVVADTRANRAALVTIRPHLRALLPFDGRPILAALREGREPPGSGIVVL